MGPCGTPNLQDFRVLPRPPIFTDATTTRDSRQQRRRIRAIPAHNFRDGGCAENCKRRRKPKWQHIRTGDWVRTDCLTLAGPCPAKDKWQAEWSRKASQFVEGRPIVRHEQQRVPLEVPDGHCLKNSLERTSHCNTSWHEEQHQHFQDCNRSASITAASLAVQASSLQLTGISRFQVGRRIADIAVAVYHL